MITNEFKECGAVMQILAFVCLNNNICLCCLCNWIAVFAEKHCIAVYATLHCQNFKYWFFFSVHQFSCSKSL